MKNSLMYNVSSFNSFPLNQAVPLILHQVFTSGRYHFSHEYCANENQNRNDKTIVLPQVRGLVCPERYRQPSDRVSIVQKSALDQTKKEQNKRKNRVQGQLIRFQFGGSSVTGDWIKLKRKVRLNDIYQMKPFSPGQAWIDLLLRASYEDRTIQWRGEFIEIKCGELVTSSRELGSAWGWSKNKVRGFLKMLKTGTMIGTQENSRSTTISILKWEEYQSEGTQNGTQKGHRRDTEGTALLYRRSKEIQEGKNNGSLSEKSREPEAEPVKVRAKAKLVI